MRVTVWGSRGSIASAGPGTLRYGGNTACITVASDDVVVVLDAGTGMRSAGLDLAADTRAVHVLVTHLHMDHIQGLGFFAPLFQPSREVHIWGPPSTTQDLRTRLTRYLSPPLFPVRLRDLGASFSLHDVPDGRWSIGGLGVTAASVIHPGPTVGYRIDEGRRSLAYLPDHEPALGGITDPRWTSGLGLALDADVLVHDGQYTEDEYAMRIGWGHSTIAHAVALADMAGAAELLLFHHEPSHDDAMIDGLIAGARSSRQAGSVEAAREGMTFDI